MQLNIRVKWKKQAWKDRNQDKRAIVINGSMKGVYHLTEGEPTVFPKVTGEYTECTTLSSILNVYISANNPEIIYLEDK